MQASDTRTRSLGRSSLARLFRYIRPYGYLFVIATLFGIFKFISPLAIIWLFGEAVDVLNLVNTGVIPAEEAWSRIVRLFSIGAVIALANPIPVFLRSYIGAHASRRVIHDIRCDLYAHVQKLSHSFYERNRSGSLTSRIITDVETIMPFLSVTLIQTWMNLAVIGSIMFYLFSRSVILGWLSIALIPVNILLVRMVGRKTKLIARQTRRQLSWLSGNTQERLAAQTIIKTFAREEDEIQKFTDDSQALVSMGLRAATLGGLNQAGTAALNTLAPLVVILVGGWLGLHRPETVSIGLLVQFVMMQAHIYSPFERISESFLVTATALGGLERIEEIFQTAPEVADAPDAICASGIKGDISFEGVFFAYPNCESRVILQDLSISVPAGQSLALVGPSGSGKSTVTHLLNRFYDVTGGRILVDERDIRDYRVLSLRRHIGLVPQDPVLFSGTILENILYGRPQASIAEVEEAARYAHALAFIHELPEGFQTVVGERGAVLSGGQRQRIAIARTFLKNPPILILDEATSALDSASERYIQNALEKLMQNRTTIIVAHRLSTIRKANQIAVLNAGQCVARGTHDELMAQGALYAQLCTEQAL
jgi:ATP-binding cassette, subfamily B, putative efflux pump